MEYLTIIALFLTASIYHLLDISFRSFDRISFAGFMDDLKSEVSFDYLGKYRLMKNSLNIFSGILKLTFFIYLFVTIDYSFSSIYIKALILTAGFILIFNIVLYTIGHALQEKILKFLLPATLIPWYLLLPFNLLFGVFVKEKPKNIDEDEQPSEKELEIFFEESTRKGLLEKEDHEMIESVIEFGDTLVKEIMTPRVDMLYLNIKDGLHEISETINREKKSRYPVIEDRIDDIKGLILSKDIFNHLEDGDFKIEKILREPFFVPETMRIYALLKEMQKSRQKFSIVVDEFGGVSGVVTMEDIIEEIVGEIQDEYDNETPQIIKKENHYLVMGDTDIYDINEELGTSLDAEEDYQTVGGLISFRLGKLPSNGDEITIDGYRFKVIEFLNNRIKKVKIYND